MAARFVFPFRRDTRWIAALVLVLLLLFFLGSSSGNVRSSVDAARQRADLFTTGGSRTAAARATDHFAHYKRADGCDFRSTDLYKADKDQCADKHSLLKAVSDGGRIGFDAPYQSRGCDMRWFNTDEICNILSRFDNIYMLGDSMVRHLAQGVNVFLREDLYTGARATWQFGNPPELDCHCHTLFENHTCASEGFAAVGTQDLLEKDRASVACKGHVPTIHFMSSVLDPPQPLEVESFKTTIRGGMKAGNSRSVYVMGQGGWNDFDVPHTQHWMKIYEGAMNDPANFPNEPKDDDLPQSLPAKLKTRAFPRLYISPNAQGINKPPMFVPAQNNIKLMNFERNIRGWLENRGWDVLGIFNLTVQSDAVDGTHATMESNLVKTMMLFNWLDTLEPEGPR